MMREEDTMLGRVGRKSKKSKMNRTRDLKAVTESTDAAPSAAENYFKFNEANERKNKKKHKVSGSYELARRSADVENGKDYIEVDDGLHVEKDQKKRKIEVSKDRPDNTNASSKGEGNSFMLSENDESKNHEVNGDIVLDDICDEALHGKGNLEVDGGVQKEKDHHNKKIKLEPVEDKDALIDKIQTEEEENRKKDGSSTVFSSMEILESEYKGSAEVVNRSNISERTDTTHTMNGEKGTEKKNNETGERDKEDTGVEGNKKTTDGKEIGKSREDCDGDITEKVEEKKRKAEDDMGAVLQEIVTKESGDKIPMVGDENFADGDGDGDGDAHYSTIVKVQDSEAIDGDICKGKKTKSIENGSENPKPKGKSKQVRFSGHLEVFPGKGKNQKELVQGKRFSKKEDEVLKEAVFNYIKEHNLGEEGLNMVLQCGYYPELKNCWKEIGQALPYRPHTSIYYRAHILFEGDRKGKWTKEELERILEFQQEHGNKWKTLASELGKNRVHVKDIWRKIKLPNVKHGRWSQEEYQNLFNLVNLDLKLKASEEKRSKHGMLRDNIAWGAISDKLSTRDTSTCCKKWYRQLTSRMVADGKWSDGDDYRLLDALYKLDACCIEDVDWDNLLSHRSGDLCRKRWDQMVLHIGEHGTKSFGEQVDTLSKRYCPDLADVREAWDNKPVVP